MEILLTNLEEKKTKLRNDKYKMGKNLETISIKWALEIAMLI